MERYNLPSNGIEVTITHDHNIYAHRSIHHHTPIYATEPSQNTSKPPKIQSWHPLLSRVAITTFALIIISNVPVYSRIELNAGNTLSNHIGAALEVEQEIARLDEEDKLAETLAEQQLELELGQYEYNRASQSPPSLPDLDNPTITPSPNLASIESRSTPKAAEYGSWKHVLLEDTQTLTTFLKTHELGHLASKITTQPEISQQLKTLKAGSRLFLRTKGKTLNQLIYTQGEQKTYVINRFGDTYQGKWDTENYIAQDTEIAFTIDKTISKSAHDAGIPSAITRQVVKIFKNDLNFAELKAEAQIRLIYQDFRYKNKSIYSQDVLAAEIRQQNKVLQRIRFASKEGDILFLKPSLNDDTLQRTAFNRRPIQGGFMSSGFGSRNHPVLGAWRMHRGTDFAAPNGTPIYATGDGIVKFIGRQSGYGKVVELSHENEITTLYGHMSAFKQGLSAGSLVQRGQVIGYVGSTGRSTGNHVHYEFRVNNQPLNPMTVALPKTGLFTPDEKIAFTHQAARLVKRLAQLQVDNNAVTTLTLKSM